MKQSEAIFNLRLFMAALQKYRSINMEELDPTIKELAAETWPWVFGDKCPLPTLDQILNRAEETGELTPLAYYNQMVILTRFMPEILVFIQIKLLEEGRPELPDHAPMNIFAGWDPE